ncbi:MAG: hypothetical protein KJ882_06110 [Proteobacteria bacterium]|nr:hypothetical protein [Pseudomonadota bacterium]MBU4010322.1 hypothetical protein [Pseudomonadota bacterium]MBU4035325.1 hypothetical protein [Pseudomonadota bacterium]
MLTKYDEFLCHQFPSTFDHVADSGDNWRENVWCCAYDVSGKIFLSAVFGVSTNRNVMDSSGLLTIDGKTQYNIRASRELRPRNDEVKVGPLSYEVIEGLKTVKWLLAENEYGISWKVEFEARMPPHEEKPQFARSRGRMQENMYRYGQSGRAMGWVKVEGKTYDIDPDSWIAHRDHSWGLRWHANLHAEEQGLQPPEPMLGITFDWNILQFEKWNILSTHREDYHGKQLDFSGGLCYAYSDSRPELKLVGETIEIELVPGTKRMKAGRVVYTAADGSSIEISFRVVTVIYIHAGGYWPYKGYRLGRWMGSEWIEGEKLDITDPAVLKNISEGPTYMVECRCGNETGTGMIQFGIHGKHHRYAP